MEFRVDGIVLALALSSTCCKPARWLSKCQRAGSCTRALFMLPNLLICKFHLLAMVRQRAGLRMVPGTMVSEEDRAMFARVIVYISSALI